MLNRRWPHRFSAWNWVRDAKVIRDGRFGPVPYDKPGEGPSRGLLRDYEPSDATFWSTRRGLLRYCENFAEGSFPESEQLIERWEKCGPPCLEDTNPATLQHFDGDQLKCSKLDIVKNNWNICVASRKIWQFYTFCCIFRHFALSFGLDIVYWRRKWNPRHNSGCLEEGTEKFFMILCCHAACFRTRCIVHFAFSLNKSNISEKVNLSSSHNWLFDWI